MCIVHKAWHFCLGNAWGNRLDALTRDGYAAVLPHYYDVDVDELVLDFACRDMVDASLLAEVPERFRLAIGVIDVRSLEIEDPEQVADRARTVLKYTDPARVTLTTDCGLKQLPRPVAQAKLRSLTAGAAIVRADSPANAERTAPEGAVRAVDRWRQWLSGPAAILARMMYSAMVSDRLLVGSSSGVTGAAISSTVGPIRSASGWSVVEVEPVDLGRVGRPPSCATSSSGRSPNSSRSASFVCGKLPSWCG